MNEPGSDVDRDAGGVPAWACDHGWLVRRGPAAPTVTAVTRASGQALHSDPGVFWLIGRDGRVARRYEGGEWGIDDELGATVYVVEEGVLLEITAQQHFRGGDAVRETIVIPHLRPVADDDAQAGLIIADAILREEREEAERAEASVRAGRGRVAAIPGADERYELGDDFDRAQELLLRQLAAFDAPETEAALRALAAFGRLYRAAPEGWRPALAWAGEPLVHAARIAANDPWIAREGDHAWTDGDSAPAAGPARDRPDTSDLLETLERSRRDLDERAGWADDTDARNTAIALRQAVRALDASRARLGRLR
ncbi:MAG TPA: hypothetical protein VFJ82_05955 [Longimicrobium sp.]|nr:hypothetical protein [Longimicrobium sp.]